MTALLPKLGVLLTVFTFSFPDHGLSLSFPNPTRVKGWPSLLRDHISSLRMTDGGNKHGIQERSTISHHAKYDMDPSCRKPIHNSWQESFQSLTYPILTRITCGSLTVPLRCHHVRSSPVPFHTLFSRFRWKDFGSSCFSYCLLSQFLINKHVIDTLPKKNNDYNLS